jgi:hypothetical protein
MLTAAAEAVGSLELLRAADGFSRAACAPWGRIPPPSPGGAALRTAAYLLAAYTPDRSRRTVARLALISALARLARAVAELRESQHRLLQAAGAHDAAAGLAAAAASNGPTARPRLATADVPWPAAPFRPAAPIGGPGPGRPGLAWTGPVTRRAGLGLAVRANAMSISEHRTQGQKACQAEPPGRTQRETIRRPPSQPA